MKKIQKILMALAICSVSIIAVGCSSNDKNNENGTTNNTNENSNGKLSNKELIEKITEALKTVKSSKATVQNTVNLNMAGQKAEVSSQIEMTSTYEPFVLKIVGKAKSFGLEQENNMYITKEGTYVQNAITKEWVKANNEVAKKQTESQKDPTSFDTMLEIMNSVEKNLTVEEKDSSYEISYSGNDQAIKEILEKILSKSGVNRQQSLAKFFTNINLEKFEAKFEIDKKTLFPKSYSMKVSMKAGENEKQMSLDMDTKTEFSEINQIKEIVLPDEVKNAKEWKGNN